MGTLLKYYDGTKWVSFTGDVPVDVINNKLGRTDVTTTISGVTTETTLASCTVTMPTTTREVEVEIVIPQVYSTVGSDKFTVKLKEAGTLIQQYYTNAGSNTGGWSGTVKVQKAAPSAGSITYTATITRDTGSGSLAVYAVSTSIIQLNVRLV